MDIVKLKKQYRQKYDNGINFNLISIEVYKFPLGDCTAGGISGKVRTLYIPCEDGPYKSTSISRDLIMIPEQRGSEYWAISPMDTPENVAGPMCGGNLAYSSDSRVKRVYHIHDRFETWEANYGLSN